MAARKTARKKSTARRKAPARKKSARRKSTRSALGDELPKSLKAFSRQVRRDLGGIERAIEHGAKDTRRSLARVMRDASHQLGALEARGEREWKKLSRNAQADVERLRRRVRKALA